MAPNVWMQNTDISTKLFYRKNLWGICVILFVQSNISKCETNIGDLLHDFFANKSLQRKLPVVFKWVYLQCVSGI